jgi:hypothetical protein
MRLREVDELFSDITKPINTRIPDDIKPNIIAERGIPFTKPDLDRQIFKIKGILNVVPDQSNGNRRAGHFSLSPPPDGPIGIAFSKKDFVAYLSSIDLYIFDGNNNIRAVKKGDKTASSLSPIEINALFTSKMLITYTAGHL